MKHKKKSWYRPDIDGLRALAIIPVVLFHARIAGFSGGFVGVDIFFVISGFLITSIVYRELKKGTFSLLTFWERRMRRIIPALSVVIVVTLIAGYFFILFPVDYIDLGQSALAQSLFLANLFFMRKNNYFAGPSESMPLLHTWSLSVEEQFYIGFPLLMLLIWKLGRKAITTILLLLGVASLFYSASLLANPGAGFSLPGLTNIWGGALNADAAFFLIFARAFELIIGALLAIGAYTIKHRQLAEGMSILGLGMILYSIVYFSDATAFPGLNALFPTLGAALIILANSTRQTFVGHLLSFPVFVWVGLISYPLYLWHWPLFALARFHFNRLELTHGEISALIIAAFILSYFTYRFVETPFREKRFLARRKRMLISGLLALISIGTLGWMIATKQGLPERAPQAARAIASATIDFGPRRSECFVNSFSTGDDPCLLGTRDESQIDFVLWGDSHAGSLLPMLDNEAKDHNLSGASFIVEGCLPVSNISKQKIARCTHVKELARAYIAEHNVPKVLLVARWSGFEQITDDPTESVTLFREALETMAAELKAEGTQVYVVKQAPKQLSFDVRRMFTEAARNPDTFVLKAVTYDAYQKYHHVQNALFDTLAAHGMIRTIDTSEVLCPTKRQCLLTVDGVLIYQDADHLNKTGAYFVAPAFADFFSN